MDDRDLYVMSEELEDDPRYDDDVDMDPQQLIKRSAYPPRLMVDFQSLGEEALRRYAKFYHLKVDEELGKDEMAAQVARHFDLALEVQEDDSIVAFMQRLRNGERSSVKRSTAREKERKALAAAEKAKRKSNSRKRQRDHSVSTSRNASSAHSSNNGSAASHHASHASASAASNGHSTRNHTSEGRKPPHAGNSKPANGGKGKKPKKDADASEDNELYCICNLPSYGNMIACDGKTCPNPSQWYHLECVGLADGRHPDTWLCPECDPKGFNGGHKKKKSKRSKSPGNK